MSTMKAAIITSFDEDISKFELATVPIPAADAGFVVVKINVASVNPVDVKVMQGHLPFWRTPFPHTLGYDFSGVVSTITEDTASSSGLQVGDRVFACNWGAEAHGHADEDPALPVGGAFAEYIRIPANKLSRVPEGVSDEDAAAVALVGLTAYQALFDVAKLDAGKRILILGGAGAVGSIAIQLAKERGVWIATTASARNFDFVSTFGPDKIIDYTATKWHEDAELTNVDFVFDTTGETGAFANAKQILKSDGVFVSICSFDCGFDPTAHAPLTFASFYCLANNAAQQDELARLLGEGKLRVAIDEVFSFDHAGVSALLSKSASGKSRGKNLLRISA